MWLRWGIKVLLIKTKINILIGVKILSIIIKWVPNPQHNKNLPELQRVNTETKSPIQKLGCIEGD